MKIGLIGNGFVGRAVYENLKQNYNFVIYDKDPALSNCRNIAEVTQENCEKNIKRAVYAMANAIEGRDGELFYIDCNCIKVRDEK